MSYVSHACLTRTSSMCLYEKLCLIFYFHFITYMWSDSAYVYRLFYPSVNVLTEIYISPVSYM